MSWYRASPRGLFGTLSIWLLLPVAASAQEAPSASPSSAPPDPTVLEEAHAHFRRGLDLYGENDFRAALVELQRAYDLAPTYRILYNIAQIQFQLRDYAGALRSFRAYLEQGGSHIDASRRAEVERDIETLQNRVATLEIHASTVGAEIYVDDVLVGVSPLPAPVVVSAGRRKISARLDGYVSCVKRVDVAGTDSIEVRLVLVKSEPQPPPSSAPPAPPRPTPTVPAQPKTDTSIHPPTTQPASEPAHPVPWVGWAITGAFATGATVTGVLALRASGDLSDARSDVVGRAALDDASRRTIRYAVATDLLAAGALIAGSISLYQTLDMGDGPEEGDQQAVRLLLGSGSLAVQGTF